MLKVKLIDIFLRFEVQCWILLCTIFSPTSVAWGGLLCKNQTISNLHRCFQDGAVWSYLERVSQAIEGSLCSPAGLVHVMIMWCLFLYFSAHFCSLEPNFPNSVTSRAAVARIRYIEFSWMTLWSESSSDGKPPSRASSDVQRSAARSTFLNDLSVTVLEIGRKAARIQWLAVMTARRPAL